MGVSEHKQMDLAWDAVSLTQAFVRIPSLSGQEQAMADFVQQVMRDLGFDQISVDEKGSVLGFVGPAQAPLALLFDAHMDVVPIAGTWTVEPFGAEIKDGRMYGRGTSDMKAGLAAALCGAAAAARSGALKQRIAVSASVMEEVIEGYALSHALELCTPAAVVICEPSRLRIMVGQKGRQEILLRLQGRPAHAALPHLGVNPIQAAARAISALQTLELPQDAQVGQALLVPTDIISDPHPSISLIPSSVTVRFDRRTLVGESSESVLKQMEQCLQAAGVEGFSLELVDSQVQTYTGQQASPGRDLPAWRLDESAPLAQAMVQAVQQAGRVVEMDTWWFCTNGSESAGRRGIPTIGLGPGEEAQAHTADESVAIDDVLGAKDIYEQLCLQLAGQA
ncbi:YgeY family selenium metabolism-linked hydrolase [Alcaligenes sp. NLF5-7]|uniref:YgeY family selenium metabolism-linked hydrolase n=1 Tax=Alcaligenes sp. NLF5-7 TaxID=2918755 RepID=UPI0020C3B567|nr:YgeY family selenium metabolism-linked hydrolase [Alcaligenes sp. NLF5-7]UTM01447.1 YgeY family selenium metabolism-linked hydrolase [Alcaligenes sp. NLF5-7]